MDLKSLTCSFNYHFDLLRPEFMKGEVERRLSERPSA
jgi:hypothetical protein